jgi:hypothetical protein
MKKWLVLSVLFVVLAVVWGGCVPVQAQTGNLKPTFLAPTPGLYVHGWPPFTVSYPKDWPEQPFMPTDVFRAGAVRPNLPPSPILAISVFGNAADISASAPFLAGFMTMMGFTEVKVLSDKPAKLQDGTPAQEAEVEFIPPVPNAPKLNLFLLAAKKDAAWIWIQMVDDKRPIGDELKRIAYTLKVAPGKQEPVKVPPDVQAFLDKWNSDIDSHDVARIMTNFSDQFRQSGSDKKATEGWFRTAPDSPVQLGITSAATTVTIFQPRGDKAYLAGFQTGNPKSGAPGPTPPLDDNQIIKENGQWKWCGNQK